MEIKQQCFLQTGHDALKKCIVLLFNVISATAFAVTPYTTIPYYIWWEAESYESGNIPIAKPSAYKHRLSNEQWVYLDKQKSSTSYSARYNIDLRESGEYYFYTRKHWYNDAFRYRFNSGPWHFVERTYLATLKGGSILAENLRADWLALADQTLEKGKHTFEIEFLGKKKPIAIDSFVLSKQPFEAMGLRHPGEKLNRSNKDYWAFEPNPDLFTDDALWDLRSLNETIAGEKGYIGLSEDKNDFILANGKPIKFWSINTLLGNSYSLKERERHAKHLAKRGFNMVRFHGAINSKTENLFKADQSEIEKSWRLVAAMKKQGIYTTLSPYWGTNVRPNPEWKSIASGNTDNLASLLFFEPTVQKAYKTWLKQWLTPTNPHTGIPLAKDTSIAIFQIQNEGSLLFWTQRSVQGEQLKLLEKQFGDWVLKKYGSFSTAQKKWSNISEASDDFDNGYVGMADISALIDQPPVYRQPRINDQYQFMLETMHNWNRELEHFLREEIGYQGLINAGNWRTADNTKMLDGERWSYSANQVMAVNRYYNSGKHINPEHPSRSSYRIANGDLYEQQSLLFKPEELPVNIKQVSGFPMIISESNWVAPQKYQSEAPFLVAAYSSLSGVDSYYWFSTRVETFDSSLHKFPAASPSIMLTYPAAALLFRKKYIQQALPIIEEHRSFKDILHRNKPIISEGSGFDPHSDKGLLRFFSKNKQPVSPYTFLLGPVITHYHQQSNNIKKNKITATADYIDKKNNTLNSVTDEINLNYKLGISTINADKAQGATGFLNKKEWIRLKNIAIKSSTEYATVMVVSLDEKPLSISSRIFLQITTDSQPYQFQTEATTLTNENASKDTSIYNGYRIVDQGRVPMNIRTHQLQIAIDNRNINRAVMTDVNGYSSKKLIFSQTEKGLLLTPPENAVYIILSKEP